MKKHRFPTVLLIFTLILAIVLSGLTTPGFLLPLFRSKQAEPVSGGQTVLPTETDDDTEGETSPFAVGNSKPFSIQPVEGMTISAEENALDRDREFNVSLVTGAERLSLEKTYTDSLEPCGQLLAAYELDAGLADDESFPGVYNLEMDLDTIGVDPENYDFVRAYRVDDQGVWREYVSEVKDGKICIQSSQNSVIGIALISMACIVGAGALYEGFKDLALKIKSGSFFNPFTGTFPVKLDGKEIFTIMLDRDSVMKAMENANLLKDRNYSKAAEDRAVKEVQAYYHTNSTKEEFYGKEWSMYNRLYNKYFKEAFQNDPYYKTFENDVKQYKDNFPLLREQLDPIAKIVEYSQTAYKFLRDEIKCKMFTYAVRIELSMDYGSSGYGATVSAFYGNPYFVLNMKCVCEGTKKAYEGCLLTLVHELFHVIQRGYVMDIRANYKFDEMLAQCVEWDAYDYFHENGTVTLGINDQLENLEAAEYFACQLNDLCTTKYPDGTLEKDDKADMAYPIAPFLRYLQKNYPFTPVPYSTIMDRYKGLWGSRSLTTILKRCFLLSDSSLTDEFLRYAEQDQTRFYRRARSNGVSVGFTPATKLTPTGKTTVQLVNKNYVIRVRRLTVDRNRNWNFAVVMKKSVNYDELMTDFKLIPLDMEEGKDWKNWSGGLFIEARKRDVVMNDCDVYYFLEADGGTAKSTEGYIWNTEVGYDLYMLTPLPKPEKTVENNKLSVKPIKLTDAVRGEVVDSVVVKLYLGKTEIYKERIPYEGWEKPWECDLDKLTLDGQLLTEQQKKDLTFTWQECITGTFETDPCLGPTDDPIPVFDGVDILGRWDMTCDSTGVDMQWIREYLKMMPDTMSEYVAYYTHLLDSMERSTGHFIMEITRAPEGSNYGYDVVFIYDAAPDQPFRYTGEFDEKTMKLSLTPAAGMMFGNPVVLDIAGTAGALTANGETSYSSEIVTYNSVFSGSKISGA